MTYLRQAGAKALAHSAYREAASRFEQALTALHPLPGTREKIERAVDLRLDLRRSLFPLNELTTVWRYLEEAEGLARTLDDPRRLGWVSAYMTGHHIHTGGHVTEVHRLAQRVEAIAGRLGDLPPQIAAQYYLTAAPYLSGDYRGTERASRSLLKSLPGQPTRERFGLATSPAVWSHAQLARALAERGVFDEGDPHYLLADKVENARACAERAVTLARGRGERGDEAWALRLLGDIASHPGRPAVATAAAHYGAAMTLASELEMRPLVAHCHRGLGRLYRRRGGTRIRPAHT